MRATISIPKLKVPKVRDAFPQEVAMEGKRTEGITRGLLRQYQESPARFLPKARGLKAMARMK